ncbi:hypothetical protein [Streptomyces sp. KN37]|uniref:hypothetical protein n=1 Tax=Streptomyces sp. KN37 TaxID=3090667 RepID=UPI002A75F399|nr:hypothetical protein [Streptomyces sp. KN37]WPO72361.1 hypothetical protein R9806_17840 [Streptomyces sp. KN37]
MKHVSTVYDELDSCGRLPPLNRLAHFEQVAVADYSRSAHQRLSARNWRGFAHGQASHLCARLNGRPL